MMSHILNIGWEANPLFNSGASLYVEATRPIVITGLQISVSMCPVLDEWGISELLACCTIAPAGSRVGFGGQQSYPGFAPPLLNSDFSFPAVVSNPSNAGIAGFIGYTGYLFSTILKKAQADAANQCIVRDGLAIAVPASALLVFHMDQAGFAADCEMQGVINYV